MATAAVKQRKLSPYAGKCIVLTTKHAKSIAIAPPFEEILGAGVLEHVVNTDELGTFSGEIERKGTALECAQKKCEWSIKSAKVDYALSSEGSFGTHPFIPFIPSNREILYFIDKKRKFHLHVTDLYTETNYQMGEFSSVEEVKAMAKKALFPSHALIIRTAMGYSDGPVFKGVMNEADLEAAVQECLETSHEHKIWVETDMRAHVNPTRMEMIGRLAKTLAERLNCLCPSCYTPGWGRVDIEGGLPCGWCGTPTDEIKAEIYGCAKCRHKETKSPPHGKDAAEPSCCPICNP